MNGDRKRIWLLVALGVLLLANIAFFFTYRVRYQQRVDALQQTLADARGQLERAGERRQRAEDALSGFRKIETDIQRVYNEHWSTPEQRLTPLLIELRRMETRSQLIPQSTAFAFTEGEEKEFGTTEMGIQFAVRGSYARIRQLINLIELSPHFVVIDSIGLTEAGEGTDNVSLTLQLKTLFRGKPKSAAAGATS